MPGARLTLPPSLPSSLPPSPPPLLPHPPRSRGRDDFPSSSPEPLVHHTVHPPGQGPARRDSNHGPPHVRLLHRDLGRTQKPVAVVEIVPAIDQWRLSTEK
jgi:hypothetical protein